MAPARAPLSTVALFGATGMLGCTFLPALLEDIVEGYKPTVRVFLRQGKKIADEHAQHPRVQIVHCDYLKGGDEVLENLRGVDAIVSILSGMADVFHYELLELAIQAGVKRFYPAAYGFTQLYRTPGEQGARLHALWNYREIFRQHIKLHPAVLAGKIEYTFIGSGDIWDMVTEPFWCPWTQDRDAYEVAVIDTGDAPIDWSHRADIARYVAASLAKPELSANAELNLPSATISQNEMVALFRKYTAPKGRSVSVRKFSLDDVHRFIADQSLAPPEITANTLIPVDFYLIVKCNEALGQFRRNQWECHWQLFPEVKRTTFEDYMKERFGEL
ncbi:NAD(P)-binding protein [Daedalea quercina L-15889]|uniref:NAD(P)-binding protein n=1 Tax=Daedalea quercina L-15889 TaxID=1314783 RepID=A0A165LW68_9APHY|nr:NAD(P)-binding protein [Daedalea quercina L-15889]